MANPKQAAMFTEGEDLPLFSGTPVTVRVAPFQQEEEVKQPRLPGMPAPSWDELAETKKSAR